jgi:glutaredoxin-related protein
MIEKIAKLKISPSVDFMADLFGITEEIAKAQIENFKILHEKSVIEKIKADIERFPTIPQLKQQLHTAYQVQGNHEILKDCAKWISDSHPTYLFGKINLAFEKYYEEDFEGMLVYLGKDLDLQKLYPERNEFHVDEVMNYLLAYALYKNATEPDFIEFRAIMDTMIEIDKDHGAIKQAEHAVLIFNTSNPLARKTATSFDDKAPASVFIQSIPSTTVPPIFEISLFEDLYANTYEIDQSIIRDILKLPQEIIKSECQKIIDDSIARYRYFEKDESLKTFFLMHSLLILGETENEENLQLVLQVLRQGAEYCDFYLGHMLVEKVWCIIYKLSKNSVPQLFDFLREPNIYTFCKLVITKTLEQYFLKNIIDRQTIKNNYVELLSFYFEKKNDTSIIDTIVIGVLVLNLVNLKAEEHYTLIEKMYKEELVSLNSIGTFTEVIEFNKKSSPLEPDDVNTIYEIYDELFDLSSNNFFGGFGDFDDFEEDLPIRAEPKIGRNDPCTCGSGKKYKKCCIDNGLF